MMAALGRQHNPLLDGSSCNPRRGTWRWEKASEGMESEMDVGSVARVGDGIRRRPRRLDSQHG